MRSRNPIRILGNGEEGRWKAERIQWDSLNWERHRIKTGRSVKRNRRIGGRGEGRGGRGGGICENWTDNKTNRSIKNERFNHAAVVDLMESINNSINGFHFYRIVMRIEEHLAITEESNQTNRKRISNLGGYPEDPGNLEDPGSLILIFNPEQLWNTLKEAAPHFWKKKSRGSSSRSRKAWKSRRSWKSWRSWISDFDLQSWTTLEHPERGSSTFLKRKKSRGSSSRSWKSWKSWKSWRFRIWNSISILGNSGTPWKR